MKGEGFIFIVICLFLIVNLSVQASWGLWANGLPADVFPKLAFSLYHDIFYGLTGTPGPKGIVFKGNTTDPMGIFNQLPTLAVSIIITNNIQTLICNQKNDLIAGTSRSNAADLFLFLFDQASQIWQSVAVDFLPNLGAFCAAQIDESGLVKSKI